MTRAGMIVATVLCAFGPRAAAAVAAPTWLPALSVSSPATTTVAVRPVLAMGPRGDIAAAWTEAAGVVVGVRQAGAPSSSFSEETVSTPGDKARLPSLAVNASGAVVVAWIDETVEQYEVAIRPPGGAFSAPVQAGPTGGSDPQSTSVAIDDAGDVLLGESYDTGGHSVAAYAWQPTGGAFAVTSISEPTTDAYAPVVAMDGAGDAVLAWEDKLGGATLVVRAITRPAAGAFGAAQTLSESSEDAFAVTAAIGAAGQAAVAWEYGNGTHDRIEASTSSGPADRLSVPQTTSPALGNGEYPAIGVGGNGEAVLAWEQNGPTSTDDAASALAGGSFGPAAEVSASGSIGDPQVATDGAGDAVIAWGVSSAGTQSAVAVTRAASGAVGPEVTLSAPGEQADYFITANVPAVAVGMDSSGDAIAGWERAGDHTIQARVYDVTGPTLSPSIPASATAGAPVAFSAAVSDPFSTVASTTWSFGDGATGEGTSPSHTYSGPGTYTVTVTATDAVGNATSESRQITVAPRPVVVCADAASAAAGGCGPLRFSRCVVPRLTGLSSAAAKRRLLSARCKLGKVRVSRRYKHARRLVVAAQSVKAGSSLAAGAPVSLTLKPQPPPRHKRRHR
jgi:hypothetical protein